MFWLSWTIAKEMKSAEFSEIWLENLPKPIFSHLIPMLYFYLKLVNWNVLNETFVGQIGSNYVKKATEFSKLFQVQSELSW